MEKQKLPNATLILVFGILAILSCCCYGLGVVFAIVAIILAKKADTLYLENPELYSGYKNVKIGKILSYIGLVINVIYLIIVIYIYINIGPEEMQRMSDEMMKRYSGGA